jgi:hypothetical protein
MLRYASKWIRCGNCYFNYMVCVDQVIAVEPATKIECSVDISHTARGAQ